MVHHPTAISRAYSRGGGCAPDPNSENKKSRSPHKPFAEVEMAKKQTRSRAARLTHPLLEKFAQVAVPPQGLFAYAVKIVCGKQTGENCCCVAGTRPGLYATEVNIQNLNLENALGL
jgi:hypothetical protein